MNTGSNPSCKAWKSSLQTARGGVLRRAFTLSEILVVLVIIVLLLGLALPAFNLISGSRSVDSAQNQISAVLGRARADAIGLQKPFGVMFLIDRTTYPPGEPLSGHVSVVEVFAAEYPIPDPVPAQGIYLDIAADTDFVQLPPGVTSFGLNSGTMAGNVRTSDGYIGYNPVGPAGVYIGAVILFDGNGHLISKTYGFRTSLNGVSTRMGTLLAAPVGAGFVNPGGAGNVFSSLGVALCDREKFKTNGDAIDPAFSGAAYGGAELGEESWIDDNSVQLLINRFNGTLIQGE